MYKIILRAIITLFYRAFSTLAHVPGDNDGAEISISPRATHIARITKDTLVVISGSTYLFMVDTPEDQGLVSTKIAIDQLPFELASKNGAVQTYQLLDQD